MPSENNQNASRLSQIRSPWLYVIGALALIGILFGVRIYFEYTHVISSAKDRLLAQTKVVDENITINLTVINLMLNNTVKELEAVSGHNLNSYLKRQHEMNPGIRTLLVTDRQGRCIYSNRDDLLGKNFSSRDYFAVPRDATDKNMLSLSPPYTSIYGYYVINITKPLLGAKNEFKGIATVALDPNYLSSVLKSTIYAADNRVSLVHSDGTVFIAIPEAKIPVTGVTVSQPGSVCQSALNFDPPSASNFDPPQQLVFV